MVVSPGRMATHKECLMAATPAQTVTHKNCLTVVIPGQTDTNRDYLMEVMLGRKENIANGCLTGAYRAIKTRSYFSSLA